MEMVEVDGLHIAYERVGSGSALVLLHGYVGDGPTTWRGQLDGLSDEFTVVAWDAPGAGRSTDPPERFGLAGYADCLAGFLEKLGLATACVPDCRSAASSPLRSSADTPPGRGP
jgi:pimeloyl-ACP methyl ester carboxylesterase